jgi:enterochelin esterase-like enzyme
VTVSGGYFIGPPATRRGRRYGRYGRGRGRGRWILLLALVIGGLVAGGVFAAKRLDMADKKSVDTHGADVVDYTIDSRFVDRDLEQQAAVPGGGAEGRPLLVLLHGRGSSPGANFSRQFFDELDRLGDRAPVVVMPAGGEGSYWHDRKDGRWGTYVMKEVIPEAVKRFDVDPKRVAIGGISMGGFGALNLARLNPDSFCAVGGHHAALWRRAADTAPGAFDDARDFARNNVYAAARRGGRAWKRLPMWMDVGREDSFRAVDAEVAGLLKKGRRDITFKLYDGGHTSEYIAAHMPAYLRFYARGLADCGS